jgi:L-type amino acid transporter 9
VLICLVVAGSLLGNSFVAGRMAVATANAGWLPRFLGYVGHIGITPASAEYLEPSPTSNHELSKSDAPRNAFILSTILSALYILLGNLRALLTFNGLGEYPFFFLTVVGALVLRRREPDLPRPYKTFILVPVIFTLVSGFVVVRGALFAPPQAVILIVVWSGGIAFYQWRIRARRSRQA